MGSPVAGVRLRPTDLVAVDLPLGSAWPALLEAVWTAGAALLPIDSRLPSPASAALVARARPTVMAGASGARRLRDGAPAQQGDGVVVATSGSTGEPRLAVLSRDALAAAVAASAEALGATAADRWLLCLPPAHIGGLLVLFRGLFAGNPAIVLPKFTVEAVAAERRARYISLVPTLVRRLLDRGADLAHLRAVLVGGDALDPGLAGAARAAGVRLVHTYGQTQSCGGVVYDGVPLPGVDVRVAAGGEVQLRGPTLMSGYRLDPVASAGAFTGDGWLRTGDGGTIAATGTLVVRGRLGDVIVTGGEKVWPAEVEDVLRDHPAIADAAVLGRPDPEWGQRVVAVVVAAPGAAPLTLAAVRGWVEERLAGYQAPRELRTVESLPRTAAGKLRRAAL